ncbi:hypothetical protein BH09ACT6_BH09ACT6_19370 [soil metagenome]
MLGNLQGWHLIVILAIVLLLFGAPKLPGLARSVGQSMRIFKSEVKTMKTDEPATADPATAASVIADPAPLATPVTVATATPVEVHASEAKPNA